MTTQFSGQFTCVRVANLTGSDSAPAPAPVHTECWDKRGEANGYTRVVGAKRFVVNHEWVESLPAQASCHFCGEII